MNAVNPHNVCGWILNLNGFLGSLYLVRNDLCGPPALAKEPLHAMFLQTSVSIESAVHPDTGAPTIPSNSQEGLSWHK